MNSTNQSTDTGEVRRQSCATCDRTSAPLRWGIRLGLALIGTLASSRVSAEPAEAGSEFIRELGGEELFRAEHEAAALVASGNFEAARERYVFVFGGMPSPGILYELAFAEEHSGHLANAFEHYLVFLRETEPSGEFIQGMQVLESEQTRQRILEQIEVKREQAERSLSSLTAQIGQLKIEAPSRSKIAVDGLSASFRNGVVPVLPGKHLVSATCDGNMADVTVNSMAGVVHRVTLLGGYDSRGPMAQVVDMTPTRVATRSTMGWVVPGAVAVFGLAGLTAGVAFAIKSQGKGEEAEAQFESTAKLCANPSSADCREYKATTRDANSASTVASAGYIAGGALLAGAVALFIFWPKTSRVVESAKVVPVVSPTAGGAGLTVTF